MISHGFSSSKNCLSPFRGLSPIFLRRALLRARFFPFALPQSPEVFFRWLSGSLFSAFCGLLLCRVLFLCGRSGLDRDPIQSRVLRSSLSRVFGFGFHSQQPTQVRVRTCHATSFTPLAPSELHHLQPTPGKTTWRRSVGGQLTHSQS